MNQVTMHKNSSEAQQHAEPAAAIATAKGRRQRARSTKGAYDMATRNLARKWWIFGLSGLSAVLFGVFATAFPMNGLQALIYFFGAYLLVEGTFGLWTSVIAARSGGAWWPLTLSGLAGIVAGVATLAWPTISALALLYTIAAWALFCGVFEIVAAIRPRSQIANRWLLALSGLMTVVFGVVLVLFPGSGALSVVWLIGGYQLVHGVVLLSISVDLFMLSWRRGRKAKRSRRTRGSETGAKLGGQQRDGGRVVSDPGAGTSGGDVVAVVRRP